MTAEPSRTETVTVADGGTYDLWVWAPAGGSGPGVLLIQEIFGVGPFVKEVATKLADLGYVVGAPDVFWRTERHVDHGHDAEGMQAAFASMGRWAETVPDETKAADLVAALEHVRALPEVAGHGVAVMGYCLGGRLTYEVAVAGDPTCAVSYYGSGIHERLDAAGQITCPILFQYGGKDDFIPTDQIEAVQAAFAGNADATFLVEPESGHAFENPHAPWHDPAATTRSWAATTAFLAEHLT